MPEILNHVYLTPTEAGARIGKSKWTIIRWIKDPRMAFPGTKVGRGYLTDEEEMRQWWTEHAQGSQTAQA